MADKLTLKMSDRIRLIDSMRANRDKWAEARLNSEEVARELSASLGVPVSKHTVQTMKKELNLRWSIKSTRKSPITATEVRRGIELLRRALIELYSRVGEKLPNYLSDSPAAIDNRSIPAIGGQNNA